MIVMGTEYGVTDEITRIKSGLKGCILLCAIVIKCPANQLLIEYVNLHNDPALLMLAISTHTFNHRYPVYQPYA